MLLSPAPCFKSIVHFSFKLVVPPSVSCLITHYSVYPGNHTPYSINSNSILPVVRVISGVLNTVRGAISIPAPGGKYMCYGYQGYSRGDNCKCSLPFRSPCVCTLGTVSTQGGIYVSQVLLVYVKKGDICVSNV